MPFILTQAGYWPLIFVLTCAVNETTSAYLLGARESIKKKEEEVTLISFWNRFVKVCVC